MQAAGDSAEGDGHAFLAYSEDAMDPSVCNGSGTIPTQRRLGMGCLENRLTDEHDEIIDLYR